ncbi:MAG: hypothetical protein RL026_2422 [Pseudomonadota bacterium]|jgi:hypothetical protein
MAETLLVALIVLVAALRAAWILAGTRLQCRLLEALLRRAGTGRGAALLRARLEELRQPAAGCAACRSGTGDRPQR